MTLEIVRLTDTLSLVVGEGRGRFPRGHVFVVQDEVSALIDSGCGLELLRELRDRFTFDLIINSHGHPDHCAGNRLFFETPLYAPVQGTGTHGELLPLSHRFFGPGRLADLWREWITRSMGFRDRPPTYFFDHGHVFDFGRLKVHAIHTPGHTRDHFCLFEPEQGLMLSFDLDLTPFGPWYGNRESDLSELRRSLQLVRDLGPAVVASSHSDIVGENVDESIEQYADVLEQRGQAILGLLDHGSTLPQLVDAAPIYGRHPYVPELLRFFEARMIDEHLKELIAQGAVLMEEDVYRRV